MTAFVVEEGKSRGKTYVNGPSESSTTFESTFHQCPASASPDPIIVGSFKPLADPSASYQF
jgi:hypothetical protein